MPKAPEASAHSWSEAAPLAALEEAADSLPPAGYAALEDNTPHPDVSRHRQEPTGEAVIGTRTPWPAGGSSPPCSGMTTHQATWVAAGLRRAAAAAGIELPVLYARRLTAEGLGCCARLGVTALGAGVVIHSAPEDESELPVLLGYAEVGAQWYRDGSRHIPLDRLPVEGTRT